MRTFDLSSILEPDAIWEKLDGGSIVSIVIFKRGWYERLNYQYQVRVSSVRCTYV